MLTLNSESHHLSAVTCVMCVSVSFGVCVSVYTDEGVVKVLLLTAPTVICSTTLNSFSE